MLNMGCDDRIIFLKLHKLQYDRSSDIDNVRKKLYACSKVLDTSS